MINGKIKKKIYFCHKIPFLKECEELIKKQKSFDKEMKILVKYKKKLLIDGNIIKKCILVRKCNYYKM